MTWSNSQRRAPAVRCFCVEEKISKESLLGQVGELCNQARRAWRPAKTLSEGREKAALLDAAAEFDGKADRTERRAADAKGGVPKR